MWEPHFRRGPCPVCSCRPGYGSSMSELQVRAGRTQRSREAPHSLARSPLLPPENHHEPSSWVCFTAKGSVTKLCGRKEGINAPKAAVKSTLQSSCSLCYLILILIETFSLCCPGYSDPSARAPPGTGSHNLPAHAAGPAPYAGATLEAGGEQALHCPVRHSL